MVEQIYNCKVCRSYAKSISGEEHEEIFSLAIEKIIIQNPKNVENYKSYFYTVLKSVYLDWIKDNRFTELDETTPAERQEPNYYKEALNLFLEKKTNDVEYKFYQELRKVVKIQYSEGIDHKEYEAKMQKLMDGRWLSLEVDGDMFMIPVESIKYVQGHPAPDKLPDTVVELLELITAIYGPELIATANAFHQWLHEVPDRPAGTIVTVSEGKSNHQPLGMIEYDQMGKRYKRMALLDPLIRHQDMAEKIAQMVTAERQDNARFKDSK